METAEHVKIPASRDNTVDQVIKHVLYLCKTQEDLREMIRLPYSAAKGSLLAKLRTHNIRL